MAAATGGRVTVDELGRRMERIEHDLQTGITGLHRRLDEMAFVHPDALDTKLMLEQAHRQELERRLSILESENEQRKKETIANRRAVITAFVAPILTAVVAALIIAAVIGAK